MITVDRSRTGLPALKREGKWLASSIDPAKEASAWCTNAMRNLEEGDVIFVLGLGSGYHVAELARRLPPERFLVIEESLAIAAKVRELGLDLPEKRILVNSEWAALVMEDRFRDALSGPIHIAKHLPTCHAAPDYFQRVENLLLGRDRISFLLQLKARPEMWALLDPDKVAELGQLTHEGAELVSIKTLQRLFSTNKASNRERLVWRALEELVL